MQKIIAEVGTLSRVNIRETWQHEATCFTPWLAENITLLSNAINIPLEVQSQEQSVGIFRADILAKNTVTGAWVLIENQIERTDHCHLGQLVTYASGLHAVTVVWIASTFTDEHRAALDWLNEITSERVQFFGLEIELWRIGESPVAPKFNVICKPNAWKNQIARETTQVGSYREKIKATWLRYIQEGKPINLTDIAHDTGVGYSTVKKWASSIREEIQQELGDV